MKIFTLSNQLSPVAFLVIIVIILAPILVNILLAVQMKKLPGKKVRMVRYLFFCRSFSACLDGSIPRCFPILCGESRRRKFLLH